MARLAVIALYQHSTTAVAQTVYQWHKGRIPSQFLSKHELKLSGLSAAFDTHNPEMSQTCVICDRNGWPPVAILLSNRQPFQSKGKLENSQAIPGGEELLPSARACFMEQNNWKKKRENNNTLKICIPFCIQKRLITCRRDRKLNSARAAFFAACKTTNKQRLCLQTSDRKLFLAHWIRIDFYRFFQPLYPKTPNSVAHICWMYMFGWLIFFLTKY